MSFTGFQDKISSLKSSLIILSCYTFKLIQSSQIVYSYPTFKVTRKIRIQFCFILGGLPKQEPLFDLKIGRPKPGPSPKSYVTRSLICAKRGNAGCCFFHFNALSDKLATTMIMEHRLLALNGLFMCFQSLSPSLTVMLNDY